MNLNNLLESIKRAIYDNQDTPHQPGNDPGGLISQIENLFDGHQNDRSVKPASQDPYGDPADRSVKPASQDPYGDPGRGVKPASEDPLGDPGI